jgi:ABC-2 type transport system ATP-binding protein
MNEKPVGTDHLNSAIALRGVAKSFDGHVAVRNLNLTIPEGSVYGLLGPNGAGKTTTLRLILRILEPDAGEISVFGGSLSEGAADRIGYLPEDRGLYHRMRVNEVLTYLAQLKGMPPRESAPRIRGWLERLNLEDWSDARVYQLSKGMQQKLQFIAAILHDPEIVILDEPFSGLDPINQAVLKEIIGELNHRGRTILFSTHMIEHAERLCDSVCILAHGDAVVNGTVAEVRRLHGGRYIALSFDSWDRNEAEALGRRPEVVRVRAHGNDAEVSLEEGGDPAEVLGHLLTRDLRIRRFEVVDPSLEQVFLERVGPLTAEGDAAEGDAAEEEGAGV